jgi:hypothetical protein
MSAWSPRTASASGRFAGVIPHATTDSCRGRTRCGPLYPLKRLDLLLRPRRMSLPWTDRRRFGDPFANAWLVVGRLRIEVLLAQSADCRQWLPDRRLVGFLASTRAIQRPSRLSCCTSVLMADAFCAGSLHSMSSCAWTLVTRSKCAHQRSVTAYGQDPPGDDDEVGEPRPRKRGCERHFPNGTQAAKSRAGHGLSWPEPICEKRCFYQQLMPNQTPQKKGEPRV